MIVVRKRLVYFIERTSGIPTQTEFRNEEKLKLLSMIGCADDRRRINWGSSLSHELMRFVPQHILLALLALH